MAIVLGISDNGQPAQSRSRGAAVQAICWRRSRFWRRRFRTHGLALAHGGFAGQGFAMNRAVSAMVVSRPIACDPDYHPNGCYGYYLVIRARALRSHLRSSHEHSASACNMRDCICRMGIGG